MVSFFSKQKKILFNEVAIANLGSFQIATLTVNQTGQSFPKAVNFLKPKRLYQEQGWMIWNDQAIASLSGLDICPTSSNLKQTPFKLPQRLAPAVPISFEAKSYQPLPQQVLSQALMTCELPKTKVPYHTVFRHVAPRFVRIYPFDSRNSLLGVVKQMKIDEAEFVSRNHKHLRQVPFYQEHFGL